MSDSWSGNQGGMVRKYNTGGPVGNYYNTGESVGPDRGTDTVDAKLTPGEFVVDRDSTEKYRPLLEAINKEEPMPGVDDPIRVAMSQLDDLINRYSGV